MNTRSNSTLLLFIKSALIMLGLVVCAALLFPPIPFVGYRARFACEGEPNFTFYVEDELFGKAYANEIPNSVYLFGQVRAPVWLLFDKKALLEHTKNAAKEADQKAKDRKGYYFDFVYQWF